MKFGTMNYTYTQDTLEKYYPQTWNHMRKYSKYNTTKKAVQAVKDG